jgi:hypothetical protein
MGVQRASQLVGQGDMFRVTYLLISEEEDFPEQ